jgi:hypothetical protein
MAESHEILPPRLSAEGAAGPYDTELSISFIDSRLRPVARSDFVPSKPCCRMAKESHTIRDIENMSALPSQHEITSSASEIERRVRRRLDFKILPILCFFMFVSFLDRGNIGNAKIQGMTEQLHMRGNDYNIAVLLFTVAYIIFGLPATLIFKKTGTQSLSVMMFLWGNAIKAREVCSKVRKLIL